MAEVNCPHPQPFCLVALNRRGTKAYAHRSLREKGAGFKVPLPEGEGFSGVFIRGFPRLGVFYAGGTPA